MANGTSPRRVERKFLGWTCVLVLLLGAPVFYSLVSPSGFINESELVALELSKQKTRSLVSPDREPASVNNVSGEFKLPCAIEQRASSALDTSGSTFQFSGDKCFSQELDLKIKNLENGYTASVIFQSVGGFTTDFIPLEMGDNRFELQSSSGRRQEVIVHRRPASSK